ncbi:MAG: hypothetical protein JRH16_23110 [Deltaproteobacteria bacterium]|nr:hypothetical protein [Deltaproteobacteria bacterium]MBW2363377.1 hypothetical protein [Deltaproteobacteria bacterium]
MDSHPIATAEQHAHERQALALTQHPIVKAAYERVRKSWLEAANPGPDMRGCFDEAFEEVMFSAAVWSLNQDPLRPKVICITRLAHRLGELQIPGSRWGIDNPDSIYRVIPISGAERYVIRGRVAERRMTENYFTLWEENMNTVDVLSGGDLVLESDRGFAITVDSDAAGGRPNHIRSAPEAHEFYIRDVMLDWAKDEPNELSIERLGAAPSTPPLTEEEQAELTARFMQRYAEFTQKMSAGATSRAANQFSLAYSADKGGALRKQVYIGGNFRLDEDEAMLIDVSDGGAAYFVVPIGNIWGTTLDIVNRTSSLNKAQSVPNADGSYTYVLSQQDPKVHNWIDPCGLGEGLLTLRMAEFPGGRPNDDLSAKSRVVPLSSLRDELPAETRWVTPAERAQQLAERAAAYKRRLPET